MLNTDTNAVRAPRAPQDATHWASTEGADPVDLHVGRTIRHRRRSLGFSQEQLADPLNLTFQQVQKYERGANRVSASKLFAIARALDCQPGDFFPPLDTASADLADSVGARMAETAAGAALQQLWPTLTRTAQAALLAAAAEMAPQAAGA